MSRSTTSAVPSVVICTRDRPDDAVAAVRSVLACNPAVPELVVVDQSETSATRDVVEAELCRLGGATQTRVIPDTARGLATARNVGVRGCRGEVIAFTDDDCRAEPAWAGALGAVFAGDDRLAIAFGSVTAVDYDHGRGFVPAYRVRRPVVVDRLGQKCRIEGIGACMAVRRAAWEALGGFDAALGAGVALRAGEDSDFVVRALVGGWRVAETPDAVVLHDGFRTWAEGRDLIRGYMLGLGATNVKMIRLGGVRAVRPVLELGWRWLAGRPLVDLNQRPPRLPRLAAFLRGAAEGMRMPLDERGRFARD